MLIALTFGIPPNLDGIPRALQQLPGEPIILKDLALMPLPLPWLNRMSKAHLKALTRLQILDHCCIIPPTASSKHKFSSEPDSCHDFADRHYLQPGSEESMKLTQSVAQDADLEPCNHNTSHCKQQAGIMIPWSKICSMGNASGLASWIPRNQATTLLKDTPSGLP